MKDSDDTIRTGKQAHEDASMAMLEAGLVPGTAHIELHTPDDVERLYEKARSGASLMIYRIPRDVAEQGEIGGRASAQVLVGMPEEVHGRVILSFDGWADDPREVFEIPVIVEFCRGLILGPVPGRDLVDVEHVRKLFLVMLDEAARAFDAEGNVVEKLWLDQAGQLWLLGTTVPDQTYQWENGRWMRNLGFVLRLRDAILGGDL